MTEYQKQALDFLAKANANNLRFISKESSLE